MPSKHRMWKLRKTIGFKIAAGYSVLFSLNLVVLAVFAYLLVGVTLASQDRERITAEIESLRSHYDTGGWKDFRDTVVDNNRFRKNNPFFTRVPATTLRNDLVFFPHHWREFDLQALVDIPGQLPGTWLRLPNRSGTCTLEILTASQSDGSFFQVGISTADRLAVLDQFRETFLTVSIPLILLAVAGGAFLSRRALLPLRNLIGTVTSIESGQMDARVPNTQTDDELDELGSLFNRMIEKINQLIRAMHGSLDSVAHDLRTPMTRFRNHAEKALQMDVSGTACREALQDCVEESDRILRMLAMLMDISEAETGTMRLLLRPVDLVPLAEGVVDMYRYVADGKGIGLETNFPAQAPLTADGDRICQVLANLLDNAVKFTHPGGMIRVSIQALPEKVLVIVSDSGMGIAPDQIHRIWDRLYRGAPSTHKGLGLGLSLVKAVVHAHLGEMRVSSTPGSGSAFEMHLPAASTPKAV